MGEDAIIATPELLEALRKARDHYQALQGSLRGLSDRETEVLGAIEAAIAKAENREG